MGSRRAQDKRRERLLAKGIEDSDLERVSAPIGLDLGALTAEETALSIIGEIVAMRHGRTGGRLAHSQRPDPRGRRVRIGGLILAAGEGRRFGATKQTRRATRPPAARARAGGGRRPVDRASSSSGTPPPRSARKVDLQGAEPVVCERWQEGQSASLRCGLEALRDVDAVLVVLGDQPGITAEAIDAVVLAAAGDEDAVRATFDGVPSHPVLLRRALLARAGELAGDSGFRDLLAGARVVEVEIGHLADPTDIDTPEELARR